MALSGRLFLFRVAQFSLPKYERLCRRKAIRLLFAKGESYKFFPLKVFYLPLSEQEALEAIKPSEAVGLTKPPKAQVLFSIPKRNFKRAVDRNRLKRQLREAYRLHKQLLHSASSYYLLAFVYIGREQLPYKELEGKLISSLRRLEEISNPQSKPDL